MNIDEGLDLYVTSKCLITKLSANMEHTGPIQIFV